MSSRQMGRALGGLFAAASTLAMVQMALPVPTQPDDTVFFLAAALTLAFGLALALGAADHVPDWWFHPVILSSQILITAGYICSGDPNSDLRLWFLWATPYTAFFFSSRLASLHLAWVALCVTTALVVMAPPVHESLRIGLMTMGTIAAVWGLVTWARRTLCAGQRRLHDVATHDALTGLANRTLFLSSCTDALARAAARGGRVIVLLVDLDRFKVVNDTFGHQTGDALLAGLAPRVAGVVGAPHLVARLGGDEFAVLVEDQRRAIDPEALARQLVGALSEPVKVDQLQLYTSGAVGYVTSSSVHDTAASLLADAAAAMYRAKASGLGHVAGFDALMRVAAHDRAVLEARLRTALANGELQVVFQAENDLRTGRIMGAEALMRWHSPDLGDVEPARFIPLAEETGLIVEMGAWVFREAARCLAGWMRAGLVDRHFIMAINVSAVQLQDGLAQSLAGTLAELGLDPGQFAVELTETAVIESFANALAVLSDLKALGLAVVLDDFGTGYSSLSYLHTVEVDAIKIDRSFVTGLREGSNEEGIVAAILGMARALGLEVIAEGVETEAQQRRLVQLGCRLAQGFLYSRPQPGDQFVHLLRHAPGEAVSG